MTGFIAICDSRGEPKLCLDGSQAARLQTDMNEIVISGRRSSHYTRMTLIFAEALGVAYVFHPLYDMTALDADSYASNPALKLPSLRRGQSVLFGALNICRALAETARASDAVVWPEELRDDRASNAQELVWHCMSTQVQLIVGTVLGKLPADNMFFAKARAGFDGSLEWLNAHHAEVIGGLRSQRMLSVFEVSLFCLIEHLRFRRTVSIDRHALLLSFAQSFGDLPAAQRTTYAFDVPPAAQ